MVNKHCAFGLCRSDSRYANLPRMANVTFFSFPTMLRDPERCRRWVKACRRQDFTVSNVNKYTYVCSLHFKGQKGPTQECPDPILEDPTSSAAISKLKKSQEGKKFASVKRRVRPETAGAERSKVSTSYAETSHLSGAIVSEKSSSPIGSHGCASFASRLCERPIVAQSEVVGVVQDVAHTERRIMTVEQLFTPEQTIVTCSNYSGAEDRKCNNVPPSAVEESNNIVSELFVTPQERTDDCSSGSLMKDKSTRTPNLIITLEALTAAMQMGYDIGQSEDLLSSTFSLVVDRHIQTVVTIDMITCLYTVDILDKRVEISELPGFLEFVSSDEEVLRILKSVRDFHVCPGTLMNSVTKCTQATANLDGESRSHGCPLIVSSKLAYRCPTCASLRAYLAQKLKRRQKEKLHPKLRDMPRDQLLSVARSRKEELILVNRKLERARKKIKQLESNHKLSSEDNDARIVLENLEGLQNGGFLKLILMEQVKVSQRKGLGTGMRWHPDILKWAANIRSKSAAAYDVIRSSGFLKLPSASTISRQLAELRPGSGSQDSVSEVAARQEDADNVQNSNSEDTIIQVNANNTQINISGDTLMQEDSDNVQESVSHDIIRQEDTDNVQDGILEDVSRHGDTDNVPDHQT